MYALIPDSVMLDGHEQSDVVVVLDGDVINDLRGSVPTGMTQRRLAGCLLIPGLVDLHSDCLDTKMHPRPTADLALGAALLELDTELVAHGITTHYLCVAIETDTGSKRSYARAVQTLTALQSLRSVLRADHRIHLRVDVAGNAVEQADAAHELGPIDLMSYMDHTPGQGQYQDVDKWLDAYRTLAGPDAPSSEEIMATKTAHADVREHNRSRVAQIARSRGTRLASHDDDSVTRVRQAVEFGASIAEFPVNTTAAGAARDAGLGVVLGAPNARRGSSHAGNLSAREVIADKGVDALASDYHPPSMLLAATMVAATAGWGPALDLVTGGPARIAGLDDRGSIQVGRRADLVALRRHPAGEHGGDPGMRSVPIVAQTWVGGHPAFD